MEWIGGCLCGAAAGEEPQKTVDFRKIADHGKQMCAQLAKMMDAATTTSSNVYSSGEMSGSSLHSLARIFRNIVNSSEHISS